MAPPQSRGKQFQFNTMDVTDTQQLNQGTVSENMVSFSDGDPNDEDQDNDSADSY